MDDRKFDIAIEAYLQKTELSVQDDTPGKRKARAVLLARMRAGLAEKITQSRAMLRDVEQHYERHRATIPTLPSLQEAAILDDGCGSGALLAALAEAGLHAVGIDPDNNFLELAKSRPLHPLRLLQADGQHLPFADKRFDLVLSKSVLEHVQDKVAHLSEIFRVLKRPGLYLDLWIPNRWWYREHHSLLPIYRCLRGREHGVRQTFGLQPFWRIDPPNYFRLRTLLDRFDWDYTIIPSSVLLEKRLLSKAINRTLGILPVVRLICCGWNVI